jgi:Uma2 family endonuclease
MHSLKTPPKTMMEVYKMLPEGTLAEIINGSILMSPAPTPAHQRTTRELAFAIVTYLKQEDNPKGQILFAPCDVFLDEHSNAVQPDIIFISSEKESIIEVDAIHGVPDMIIEVLSPGNSQHDLVTKRPLYEKFGVNEYWIVTPETKETIGFFLKDGSYVESGRYTGKIHSVLLGDQTFAF